MGRSSRRKKEQRAAGVRAPFGHVWATDDEARINVAVLRKFLVMERARVTISDAEMTPTQQAEGKKGP